MADKSSRQAMKRKTTGKTMNKTKKTATGRASPRRKKVSKKNKVSRKTAARPRQTVGKKVKKKAVRRKVRRKVQRRSVRISEVGRASARALILQRDAEVLKRMRRSADPRLAYELAAELDGYIDRLANSLRR